MEISCTAVEVAVEVAVGCEVRRGLEEVELNSSRFKAFYEGQRW